MPLHKFIKTLLFAGNSTRLRHYVKLMRYLHDRKHRRLATWVAARIQNRFGVYISPFARIAPSVAFPHPTGIVIGDGVVLEDRVKIFQNVTLGGARIGDQKANNYPHVGESTVIFAGAVIVGKVRIGRNCIIGANAVVLADVPDNATAVGIPARVVRRAAVCTPHPRRFDP